MWAFFLAILCVLITAQPTYNTGLFSINITDPPFLAKTIAYLPAEYGPNIVVSTPDLLLTGQIVLPPDADLCNRSALTPGMFTGNIVLATYGFCNAGKKSDLAASFGATLLILYGCPLSSCSSQPLHVFTSVTTGLTLPTVMIHYNDGIQIVNAIKQNASVVMASTEGTSAILTTERDALTSFARALPVGAPLYVNTPRQSGNLRNWTDLLDDSTVGDPCLDRVVATWCLSGRIVELYSSDLNIKGNLPPQIGNLTSLVGIQFATSSVRRITGPIPCELGQITNLLELRIPNGGITTLVNDPVCWPSHLRAIDLSTNLIPSLPTIFSGYTTLAIVDFSNNLITNYVDFSLSVNIETLNLGLNLMSGNISNFSVFPKLTTLQLGRNFLKSPDTRFLFNNLTYLTLVDLSANSFAGGVPWFTNSKNIVNLDISKNNFTGTLPPAWNLPVLSKLNFAHNSITDFYPALLKSIVLTEFNGGYNLYNVSAPYVPLFQIRSARIVNLEYNLVYGTWPPGIATSTVLQVLKYGGNSIRSIPSTLFTDLSALQIADFSNNLLTGSVPTGYSPALLSAKFKGNADFKGSLSAISYIKRDTANFVKSSIDATYFCPLIVGVSSDLVLDLDPIYYNYSQCTCQQGTFGMAPNCQYIPDFTPVDAVIQTTFTDAAFGNQRLQPGINTLWDVSQNNSQTVKVVEFTITLNLSEFTDFEDVISIYEGGRDLAGTRVFQLRGSQAINQDILSLRPSDEQIDSSHYIIRVFSTNATLNFQSRDGSGTHFQASTSFADICPAGFTTDLSSQCRHLVPYTSSTAIEISIYFLMSSGLVLMVATMFIVFVNINMIIIRASSPLFCLLTLTGLMGLAIGSSTYIQVPTATIHCHLRVWLTALPIVIILSNLLVKVDRIRNIFSAQVFANLQKQYRKFTNERLLTTSAFMVGVEIIFLIIFSGLNLSKPTISEGPGSDDITLVEVHVCSSEPGYLIWLGLQLAYIGGFLIWGAYLAFLTKDTPTAFNESTHIFGALVLFVFLGIILVPLNFMDTAPSGLLLIRGIGQSFAALTLTAIIFGPKLYVLWTGKGDDKSTTQDTTHVPSHELSPSRKPEPKGQDPLPSVLRMESSSVYEADPSLSSSSPTTERTMFIGKETIPTITESQETEMTVV